MPSQSTSKRTNLLSWSGSRALVLPWGSLHREEDRVILWHRLRAIVIGETFTC